MMMCKLTQQEQAINLNLKMFLWCHGFPFITYLKDLQVSDQTHIKYSCTFPPPQLLFMVMDLWCRSGWDAVDRNCQKRKGRMIHSLEVGRNSSSGTFCPAPLSLDITERKGSCLTQSLLHLLRTKFPW